MKYKTEAFSEMQAIYNIAEICARKKVTQFILSPGSRCAPLTISLVRHPEIETRTISDERSAAFIALGTAQQSKKTTGVVCTSGSAAFNYAPAVAEAYYQQIPLLILTADRPPEWIDQNDGQTIRQTGIYGSHVKKSFNFPVDTSHPDSRWEAERIVSEAINLSQEFPQGPVHINIPLREPLYSDRDLVYDTNVKVIDRWIGERSLPEEQRNQLLEEFMSYSKILVVGGQNDYNEELISAVGAFSIHNHAPVVGDVISNLPGEGFIHFHDIILSSGNDALMSELKPDLVITFGKSLISKNLKTFLRKNKPAAHWHIQPSGYVADTFQSLTKIIEVTPLHFFLSFIEGNLQKSSHYLDSWKNAETIARDFCAGYFNSEKSFSEFSAIYSIIHSLPERSILHLANSMPVRYVNYITLKHAAREIEVFGNRGTSGIDGTISTAYGAALNTDRIVTVITGDMAFFYDRNAWWNNYPAPNLRVIVLNNHGGGIFRIIDGPSRQPELDEYFETRQRLLAENTAKDFDLDYSFCTDPEKLQEQLASFFEPSSRAKIIEIETSSRKNTEVFKSFKNLIPALYGK